jgi:hypothetical protein
VANSYNGYSWPERLAKFKEMGCRIASHELSAPTGPCRLCGDPGDGHGHVKFEYHDEDYSQSYEWSEPAAYVLCRDCHIYRLHQRFARPNAWIAFIAHVRRGGYARELKDPAVNSEVAAYRAALQRGCTPPVLAVLREYRGSPGQEWFARLSLDPASMSDAKSRARP